VFGERVDQAISAISAKSDNFFNCWRGAPNFGRLKHGGVGFTQGARRRSHHSVFVANTYRSKLAGYSQTEGESLYQTKSYRVAHCHYVWALMEPFRLKTGKQMANILLLEAGSRIFVY